MVIKNYAPPSSGIGQTSGVGKPLVTQGRGLAATTSEPAEIPTMVTSYSQFYTPDDYDHGSGISASFISGAWQQWPGWFISVPPGHSASILGAYSALSTDGTASSTAQLMGVRSGTAFQVAPANIGPAVLPGKNFYEATKGSNIYGTFTGEVLDGDYIFPISAISGSFSFWVVTLVVIFQQTAT